MSTPQGFVSVSFPSGGGVVDSGVATSIVVVDDAGGVAPATFGPCSSCGRRGYLHSDGTCLLQCTAPPERRAQPTVATAAPARRPTCDCGAAAADPVSTRREGGGGHAEWCMVRGLP